MSNPKP